MLPWETDRFVFCRHSVVMLVVRQKLLLIEQIRRLFLAFQLIINMYVDAGVICNAEMIDRISSGLSTQASIVRCLFIIWVAS